MLGGGVNGVNWVEPGAQPSACIGRRGIGGAHPFGGASPPGRE
jgi:hypothetical protein